MQCKKEAKATVKKKEPEKIEVDLQTAVNLKVLEYDKAIANAESIIANIKKEKMEYLYNISFEQAKLQSDTNKIKKEAEKKARKETSKNGG
jgi:asparagine synthetase B (glutamine-hydrolysing)